MKQCRWLSTTLNNTMFHNNDSAKKKNNITIDTCGGLCQSISLGNKMERLIPKDDPTSFCQTADLQQQQHEPSPNFPQKERYFGSEIWYTDLFAYYNKLWVKLSQRYVHAIFVLGTKVFWLLYLKFFLEPTFFWTKMFWTWILMPPLICCVNIASQIRNNPTKW